MTRQELKEYLEISEKATAGPWYPRATDDDVFMNATYISTDKGFGFDHDGGNGMDVDSPDCEPEKVIAITLLQSPRLAVHESEKWDENTEFIAQSRIIGPYAAKKLLEAMELIKKLIDYYNDGRPLVGIMEELKQFLREVSKDMDEGG